MDSKAPRNMQKWFVYQNCKGFISLYVVLYTPHLTSSNHFFDIIYRWSRSSELAEENLKFLKVGGTWGRKFSNVIPKILTYSVLTNYNGSLFHVNFILCRAF